MSDELGITKENTSKAIFTWMANLNQQYSQSATSRYCVVEKSRQKTQNRSSLLCCSKTNGQSGYKPSGYSRNLQSPESQETGTTACPALLSWG